jgi:hypothetical protein
VFLEIQEQEQSENNKENSQQNNLKSAENASKDEHVDILKTIWFL